MRAKSMRMWIVAATLGATALLGSNAVASDYPPDDTTATTVPQGGTTTLPERPELPATGSDANSTMKIAGGAVVAGAGLLVAAKMRRRPSAG